MPARLGPTITAELRAAGITNWNLEYLWAGGLVLTQPGYPQGQRAIIDAVLTTHDPNAEEKDDVRDAYMAAKQAIVDFNANSTLATAKPAIIKLGQCVEELLKFLNRRIA